MSDGIHISGKMTAMDILKILMEHAHSNTRVYPELANPILLTAPGAVWDPFPTPPTQIIPANTITKDFDIHWVHVSTMSANAFYQGAVYTGDAPTEVQMFTFDFSRSAVQSAEGSIAIMSEMIPANTRISASITSNSAGGPSARFSFSAHTY